MITARANFARYSPRKVGQVLDLIRGKSVHQAFITLGFVKKISAELVIKTLKSAAANAGKTVDWNRLYVKQAYANQGPVLKRLRCMAMGRGAIYKRKTCHLTIVLEGK